MARLPLVDLARTAALTAMIVFHFGRDMEVLGMLPPGATFTVGWRWAAYAIAGTFVALAGASLWLAHGRGVRWPAYGRRLGILVVAAGAVSAATYVAMPGAWVRFGILHSIAASSMIGLAFLRLPWIVTAGVGAALVAAGGTVVPALSGSAWLWLGLSPSVPAMIDYEPVVPWTGPFLLGLAAAKAADGTGRLDRLRGWPDGPTWRRLAWPGRHSLTVYLVHQPVLIGLLLAWSRLT